MAKTKLHRVALAIGLSALAAPLVGAAPVSETSDKFSTIELSGDGNLDLVHATPIDEVELRGGGTVTLRHGKERRLTVRGGTPGKTRLAMERGDRLVINACEGTCRSLDLKIDIVTPQAIEGMSVKGGGVIRAEGRFPTQPALAVSIAGGGSVEAEGIEAATVAASVSGGGNAAVHPRDALVASVRGGGLVTYAGNPQVTPAISGGGSIQRRSGATR
jgi:hypothetical protein